MYHPAIADVYHPMTLKTSSSDFSCIEEKFKTFLTLLVLLQVFEWTSTSFSMYYITRKMEDEERNSTRTRLFSCLRYFLNVYEQVLRSFFGIKMKKKQTLSRLFNTVERIFHGSQDFDNLAKKKANKRSTIVPRWHNHLEGGVECKQARVFVRLQSKKVFAVHSQ